MGFYYPIPPPSYDRKPESSSRLLVHPRSPFHDGLVFDWVGGNTELFDNMGRASIRPSASRPARVATREGIVSRFVEDADERLVVNAPPLLDFLGPWTVAFRIWPANAAGTQYVCQIHSTSGDPLQILLSVSSYDVVIGTDIPGLVVSSRSGLNSFPIEQWNNCVIVFNGDDKNSLSDYTYYINGVAYSANTGINIGVADNETWIGRATNTSGRDYGGDMAGIRVWRNRDLSPPLALELSRNWWAPGSRPIEFRADAPLWFFAPEDTGDVTLVADSGSYNYTGYDATLTGPAGSTMVAEAGSYAYTGSDADFLIDRYMTADSGSYGYTGYDANLTITKGLIADSGVYGYTGYDATLIAPKKIIAETGSYGYTGYNVTLSTTAEARWQDLPGDPAGPWMDL